MKNGKLQENKERLKKKCNDWSEKNTSSAAKEAMFKSVAQAIPCHDMSIFKFSAGLCDDMSHIIRDCWWGDDDNEKKTH